MTQRTAAFAYLRYPGLAGGLLALVVSTIPPAAGQNTPPLRIQEVLYDGSGTDSEEAFTEISGPPGKVLDGWSLVGVNGSNGQSYRTIALDGATIPADGLLVVAHQNANGDALTHRDFTANVDWQNGPDAVQLHDPQGQIVDALQYGNAGQHNAGEGNPAPEVEAGQSLSRSADGSDTDDNQTDFTAQDNPTPGTGAAPPGPEQSQTPETSTPSGARLILPDTTASYGTRIDLPVRLTGVSGENIVAVELFVAYDPDLLTAAPAAVVLTDLTADWVLEVNTAAGTDFNTLKIVLASPGDSLGGDGTLVSLSFDTADLRQVTTAQLFLTHALLNDGALGVSKTDGRLRWIGATGTLEAAPLLLFPGTELALKVRDEDEDRDPASSDDLVVRLEVGADTEQVTLVEVDASTGLFQGSLATVRGVPVSGNDRIEVGKGSAVTACYDDSLNEAGDASKNCVSVSVGGEDGLLAVTAAAEPGDSLRILVTDPDLNLDPLVPEQFAVEARRNGAGNPVSVTLMEVGADDSQFVGRLAVKLTGSESALAVARGDRVEVSYDDALTQTGVPDVRTAATNIVGLFGDADGNGRLQTFDAAQVLSHVLEPFLTGLDSLAANVDAQAFDPAAGNISPLDASLILQHRVGLIPRFPVQEDGSDNHPPIVRPGSKALNLSPRLALKIHPGYMAVWIDERSAAPSGSMLLEGVRGRVELDPDLAGFLLDYRHRDG
ncbi:MAG: lamin tail domain-containing protein, partial [Gemmatimonadetes bacterium]|nr:lamin tail domain-containing protein [Gemmatimonadota bacterium]